MQNKVFIYCQSEHKLKTICFKRFWELKMKCDPHDIIWGNLFYKSKLSRLTEIGYKVANKTIFTKDELWMNGLGETNLRPNCNRKKEDILNILIK